MDAISDRDLRVMRKRAGEAAAMMAALPNKARLRVPYDLVEGERAGTDADTHCGQCIGSMSFSCQVLSK
jgi:hypothetical protein